MSDIPTNEGTQEIPVVAPAAPISPTVPVNTTTEAKPNMANGLQQQFDELTERKKALWATIEARLSAEDIRYNYAHEHEPEWQEIVKLDRELLVLDKQIKGGQN